MKIGVFGDSFVQSVILPVKGKDESWVGCIKEKGYDITSYGLSGTSTWYSFKQFLETHRNFTHIIFSYSSIHRIHNLPTDLEQFANYFTNEDRITASKMYQDLLPAQQEIISCVYASQKYIKDDLLDKFTCQNVFNEVNRICKKRNIKIVNLLPFNTTPGYHENLDLTHRNGDCITRLVEISTKELPSVFREGFFDPRCCHLSYENNMVLADMLLNSLENGNNDIIDTLDCGKFVFSPEITNRYQAIVNNHK